MDQQRREFLAAAGALAGAAALSGCATTGGGTAGKVVVVGGGYGGATAAKYLRMWSNGTVGVTLIESRDSFVSCPLSNLVIGGSRTIADLTVPYDQLARRWGVDVVRDTATAVDVDKRVVTTAGGRRSATTGSCSRPASSSSSTRSRATARTRTRAVGIVPHAWQAGRRRCSCASSSRRCPTAAPTRS
jgi:hypothetical protein